MRAAFALGLLLGFISAPARAADPAELARAALAVLRDNCYRCHGQDGNREGGLGAVLDTTVLRAPKLRVAALHAVDPAGLVLRVDLRDLLWDNNLWNRLLAEYPYGVIEDTGAFRAVAAAAATRLPVVRADWFLATASRPPLYYDLLQLPTTAGELERQLRIDAALDIRQEP